MVHFNRYFILLAAIILSAIAISSCATEVRTYSSASTYVEPFDHFGTLTDYGEWRNHARFGSVWRPYVFDHWRPFYYGHWSWSNYGWIWMSYEPYGWIVYHHGHWFYDPVIGWVWVPGYQWSPAVVVWIYYDDYVGWAPLPPSGIVIPDPWDDHRWVYWNMVVFHNFHHDYVGNFLIRSPLTRPIQKTKIVRDPPDVRTVERITKSPIQKMPIQKNPVVIEKHRYDRILVPRKEATKIEKHAPEVQKKVLKPSVKKN
jgi:hypothetical protein